MTTLLHTGPNCGIACDGRPLRHKLVARLRAWQLDSTLASGASPDSAAALSLRAQQLISRRSRRRLAHGLRNLLCEADHPPSPWCVGVPICRREVILARDELEAITERLLSSLPVDVRGLAQLQLLLRDGSGPFYYPPRARTLKQALWEANEALEVLVHLDA